MVYSDYNYADRLYTAANAWTSMDRPGLSLAEHNCALADRTDYQIQPQLDDPGQ